MTLLKETTANGRSVQAICLLSRMKLWTNNESREIPDSFTLVELLVVIAIIALLAGILLSALAKAKEKGRQIYCLNNTHQLGRMTFLYLNDSNDIFPAANYDTAQTRSDWISWQDPRVTTTGWNGGYPGSNTLFGGPFILDLVRCPSDFFLKKKPDFHKYLVPTVFFYDYTLSCSSIGQNELNGNSQQYGMASFVGTVERREVFLPFNSNLIRSPSEKIMFAEQAMFYEQANPQSPRYYIWGETSGWRWPKEEITARHSGRGNVTFADGHSAAVLPALGKMKEHYRPDE